MSKPDWCPQRVWDHAQEVESERINATWDGDVTGSMTISEAIIARAMLAAEQREREACAQVADAEEKRRTNWMETRDADFPEMKERQRVGAQQSRLIAAAIRNRGAQS